MLKIFCAFGTKEIRERFYKEAEKNLAKKRQCYMLVPEQQVLAYEDESIRLLPPSAPLHFTVASFSLLSDLAQRKYGGLSYKMLSKPIKTLFMWKAIREVRPYLRIYGKTGIEGLTPAMISCTDELKASGISPEDLADAKNFLSDSPEFAGKIADISLIYSAYKALCGSKYSDANDSLAKLNKLLGEHGIFSGCEFFIDSFTDFTPIQFSILEKLVRRADVSIAFPTDVASESSLQFEDIHDTFRKLRLSCSRYGIPMEIIRKEKDINCSLLEYAQDNVWRTDAPPYPGCDTSEPIEIYSCADVDLEVGACINLIKRAVYNGCSYSDIAVISRDPQRYERMLASAASEAGIPLFTSDRASLSDRIFVTYITSLLRIICNGWQREDVNAHLKCGLCRASMDDVNRFELYTCRWKLNGKRHLCEEEFTAPYKSIDKRSESDAKYIESANRIRTEILLPIAEFELSLQKLDDAPSILKAIFEFAESMDARGILARLAGEMAEEGDLRGADQTSRVYSTTIRLFDDISFALSDGTKTSVTEVAALLGLMFEAADIGSIPTRQNEVILADASFYRSFGHKQIILLGCNDGAFPKQAKSAGLLSYAEKDRLRSEGLPLEADACRSVSKEYLFFWRSMSMAREKLILTYTERGGGGGTGLPCSAIAKICYLCKSIKVQKLEDSLADILYDPKALLPFIAARYPESDLYFYLSRLNNKAADGEKLTYEGGSLSGAHRIPPEDIDLCIGDPIRISPTELEKYNKCPFMYFCGNILGLDSGEIHKFNARISGNLVHRALEDYLNAVAENGQSTEGIDADEICRSAARKYYDEICPPHMRDNERMKIAFERAAINAALLAGYVGADLEKTDFLPMAYEFSTDANNCGLHVKAERDAIINGRIDRIDRAEKGGEEFLRIVDYKTGSKEYSYENLRTGIDLQLPLYLRAVTADESKQPGGFIYLSSAMPKITLGSASELEDKERLNALLVSKITASGVINSLFSHKKSSKLASYSKEQINELLDDAERVIENSVNSMTYGYFNAEPACINKKYPCEYCSFATVCRRRRYSKD